jgi:heme/copper-type cytochrome/quinol oxidase subunit 1
MSFDPRGDQRYRPEEQEHALSIPLYLLLTLLTCFLFDLYWNYRQMKACNDLLGREEFHFWLWVLFCVITFGLYHFYYQYQMGRAIVEIQERRGLQITEGLPVLSVAATLIGFGVVADCIHQLEINRIVD